jgi:Ca2+-binding RTX toxin-like protein
MADKRTVDASTNTLLAGLKRTTQWESGALTTYTATAADAARIAAVFQDRIGVAPVGAYDPLNAGDEDAWLLAIQRAQAAYSLVANFTFTAAADINTADIVWGGGYNSLGGTTVARMDAPGENLKPGAVDDYQSFFLARMNSATYDAAGETGGGSASGFIVLHEFGHSLGLSHPHNDDRGTTAWSTNTPTSTDNKADNARYTVMSYEIGGIDTLTIGNFGNNVTPAALDIAALQDVYGSRAAHTGNTVYTLTDGGSSALDLAGGDGSISIGRAFYTIWDTGGTDEIRYDGARNAYINLNDATLVQTAPAEDAALLKEVRLTTAYTTMVATYGNQPFNELTDDDYNAGGYYSTIATGGNTQMGGYSIANGVTVEEATGGSGTDMLIGNAAANTLTGNGGNDMLAGGKGNDTLDGGAGDDELVGGEGSDSLVGGAGDDTAFFDGPCASYTITRDDETGIVTVSHLDGSGPDGVDTLVGVETAEFTDGSKDLTAEEIEACPPLDFIFLVDLSGSFSDDLFSFRAAAREIASDLRSSNPDVRFAIASFVDLPVSPFGSAGDYLYRAELALTDDAAAFESALNGLSTLNGGDGPEAQWVGLWRAANGVGLSLREDSSRVIYMATDAPAHTASDYGLDETTIRNFLETEGIDVSGGLSVPDAEPASAIIGGDSDALEDPPEEPTVRPDGDPGHDVGITPTNPTRDALLAEVGAAFRGLSATPIIGTTAGYGSGAGYEDALDDMGSSGAVIETTSSGTDIADAIRAGLASIAGDVTEVGSSSGDTLVGTAGNDVLLGLGAGDLVQGLGGNDSLDGSAGDDTLEGGDGTDTLAGGSDSDLLDGGTGDDILRPGAGIDTITGGTGMDLLTGNAAAISGDRFLDFGLNDAVVVDSLDLVAGTAPTMAITADGAGSRVGVDVNADGTEDFFFTSGNDLSGLGLSIVALDAAIGIGRITFDGTAGADDLSGSPLDNFLNGLAGNDTIRGGLGADWITPGAGDDAVFGGTGSDMVNYVDATAGVIVDLAAGTARGGSGTDSLDGIENVTGSIYADLITGDAGANRIRALGDYDWIIGSGGADSFDGGNGRDMVSYVNATSGVTASLATGRGTGGQANGDRYTSIERLTGSIYHDVFAGDAGENDFRGLGGYDWFVGSAGRDRYDGGSGVDTMSYSSSTGAVSASLLLGRGTRGDAARDLYTSIENLTGSSFADILTGDNGRNTLRGLYGADTIYGNGGVDWITGGRSDDIIDGGSDFDYAYFSATRAEYRITTTAGTTTVDFLGSGGDGTDTLLNIEALVFSDTMVFL